MTKINATFPGITAEWTPELELTPSIPHLSAAINVIVPDPILNAYWQICTPAATMSSTHGISSYLHWTSPKWSNSGIVSVNIDFPSPGCVSRRVVGRIPGSGVSKIPMVPGIIMTYRGLLINFVSLSRYGWERGFWMPKEICLWCNQPLDISRHPNLLVYSGLNANAEILYETVVCACVR